MKNQDVDNTRTYSCICYIKDWSEEDKMIASNKRKPAGKVSINQWKVKQLLFFLPVTNEKTRLILYNIERKDFMQYLKSKKNIKKTYEKIILKWLKKYR